MNSRKHKSSNKNKAKLARLAWSEHAWEDYLYWQSQDRKIALEINGLIEECLKDPFKGTGKPEPLRGDLSGYWSRRITAEHRLVYLPHEGQITIVMCRYHY